MVGCVLVVVFNVGEFRLIIFLNLNEEVLVIVMVEVGDGEVDVNFDDVCL